MPDPTPVNTCPGCRSRDKIIQTLAEEIDRLRTPVTPQRDGEPANRSKFAKRA